MLKLSRTKTGGTKDRLTEELNVVDYLIYRLNTSAHALDWHKVLGLSGPTDDVHKVLEEVALAKNLFIHNRKSSKETLDPRPLIEADPGYAFAFEEAQFGLESAGLVKDAQGRVLDTERAARKILDMYRDGAFGTLTLDDCSPESLQEFFTKSSSEKTG